MFSPVILEVFRLIKSQSPGSSSFVLACAHSHEGVGAQIPHQRSYKASIKQESLDVAENTGERGLISQSFPPHRTRFSTRTRLEAIFLSSPFSPLLVYLTHAGPGDVHALRETTSLTRHRNALYEKGKWRRFVAFSSGGSTARTSLGVGVAGVVVLEMAPKLSRLASPVPYPWATFRRLLALDWSRTL
jgi:hypothetical protein